LIRCRCFKWFCEIVLIGLTTVAMSYCGLKGARAVYSSDLSPLYFLRLLELVRMAAGCFQFATDAIRISTPPSKPLPSPPLLLRFAPKLQDALIKSFSSQVAPGALFRVTLIPRVGNTDSVTEGDLWAPWNSTCSPLRAATTCVRPRALIRYQSVFKTSDRCRIRF